MTFHVGQKFEIDYPFVRVSVQLFDGDGYADVVSWRPGTENETRGGALDDPDIVAVAHGLGKKISTVVECVKLPRPFPPRVFFTVSWVSPDGTKFGKNKLRVATRECFLRKATGFAYPFEVVK